MRCSVASLVGGVWLLAASTGWAGQKDLDDQKGRGNLCPMNFEATVHYGPDTNVALKGTLYFTRHGDEGTVDGTLADEAGFSVPVHGQILGRAANLLFDLGDDAFVYGTGTVLSSRGPDGCTTYKGGGTLTGPDPADIGSWLIIPIKGSIGLTPTCPGHISVTIAGPGVFEVGDPPQRVLQVISNNACISTTNSAVTIGNPNTAATSGPFTLQLDMATGRFIAFIGDASFPDNQCRTLTFNNFFLGLKLGPVTVCLPIPPGTSFKFG
jgi:hypothetical protein